MTVMVVVWIIRLKTLGILLFLSSLQWGTSSEGMSLPVGCDIVHSHSSRGNQGTGAQKCCGAGFLGIGLAKVQ